MALKVENTQRASSTPRLNVRRIFAEIAGSQPVDLVLAYLLVPCFFRVTNRKPCISDLLLQSLVKHRDPLSTSLSICF